LRRLRYDSGFPVRIWDRFWYVIVDEAVSVVGLR
jgi:hypothetical protein